MQTESKVLYEDQIIDYIKSKKRILINQQIDEIYEILNNERITDEEQIKNHSYNVQKYVEYKNKIANTGVCPRCGGNLVKRNGKTGEFYGCSNFPKCHYMKSI